MSGTDVLPLLAPPPADAAVTGAAGPPARAKLSGKLRVSAQRSDATAEQRKRLSLGPASASADQGPYLFTGGCPGWGRARARAGGGACFIAPWLPPVASLPHGCHQLYVDIQL
jgi:hypothetical protein